MLGPVLAQARARREDARAAARALRTGATAAQPRPLAVAAAADHASSLNPAPARKKIIAIKEQSR